VLVEERDGADEGQVASRRMARSAVLAPAAFKTSRCAGGGDVGAKVLVVGIIAQFFAL
jgi:hypothetical protein